MSKRNKKLVTLAGVVALLVIASVFAYFYESASIDNPLHTKAYGGEEVEKFTPEPDWEPGEEVGKEVKATNTGDYPLIVRVKFDEKWTRTADGTATPTTIASATSADDGFFPESAAAKTTTSTVYKNIKKSADWVFCEADGYYYYQKVLNPKESTPAVLESLTLCADTNMGEYTTTMKYAVVKHGDPEPAADAYTLTTLPDMTSADNKGKDLYQKKIVALDPAKAGYAKADYTLTVTVDFCQADKDAATANSWDTATVTALGIK